MKFNDKKLSQSLSKNLREMAMDKPPRFNPHPDIERELSRGETSIPSSTMPETGFQNPNVNFQELLASERYRTVIEKMQEYLGQRAPAQLRSDMDLMPLMQMLQNAVFEVERLESEHKEELENLAVELVKKELGVPEDKIIYSPHLVDRGNIPTQDFERNQPNQPNQPQRQQPNQAQMEAQLAERLQDFDLETAKRRLINAILQGASKRGHYMYHLVSDKVREITGSEDIINLYGIIMSINDTLYWQFSNQMLGMAMEGDDFVGGKEKVLRPVSQDRQQEPDQQDQQGEEGDEGQEECMPDENLPTVCAWGVNFPILVHELLKGTYEIIGIHGQPSQGFEDIKSSEDTLDKEIWDLRLGPAIWDRLRSLFPAEILIEDNQKQLQLFLLTAIFRLPAREFLVFIKEAMQKSDEGKRLLGILFAGAKDNMKRLESRQQRQAEDQPRAEQFKNEVEKISEDVSDDEINSFLDSLIQQGIGRAKDEPAAEPTVVEPEAEKTIKDIDDKKLASMGLNALNFEMNKAIDDENWELAQKIQRMIDRKQGN